MQSVRSLRGLAMVMASGLLLSVTACGGGESAPASEEQYVAAIAAAWNTADGSDITVAQGECWGQKLLDQVGIEPIRRMGDPAKVADYSVGLHFLDLALAEGEAEQLYANFGTCGVRLDEAFSKLLDEQALPEQLQVCIEKQVDDRIREAYFVESFQKGMETALETFTDQTLAPALDRCVDEIAPELDEAGAFG